jgi:hypothetical protein
MTAAQRRKPTTSFRKTIAKTVMKKLLANPIAVASARGIWTIAVKPQNMATMASPTRAA